MALKMKLVFPLLVVLLVSTDAKFPDFGKLFGKLPYKKINIPSIAEKIRSKLPFLKSGAESPKSYVEPSGKKSPPTFCGSHDCPHFYEVKLNATDYTLRCYPESYRWVTTTVTGETSKQAGRTSFWRLFKYIQGANEEKMKIKMTVPVTNQIQPDTKSESFCKNNFTMSFFIPFKHQKNAPAPSDDNVHLTVVKPFCAYVRVYGGYSNMEKVEQHYNALVKSLKRDGLADDFQTDMMYSVGYDEPRKVFNRHNEIWLVSKKQSPAPDLLRTKSVSVEKEEKFPNFGKIFGKVSKWIDLPSIAEKIRSKFPFVKSKSSAEPAAEKSPPTFCNSYDCPEFYEVKLNASDYTLRCYSESYRWVTTTVTSENSRQAGRTAFWRLFRYIQGANEEKMKIKMTVPVTNQIQPDTKSESFCKNNFTVSFFIPFKHQKNAPAPSEENVHLTVVKPFCAYVRVYGGYSNMEKVEQHYNALVKALNRDGLGDDFSTDVIYTAGYNDPMEVFNRHNEIWLVSKKQSPAQLKKKGGGSRHLVNQKRAKFHCKNQAKKCILLTALPLYGRIGFLSLYLHVS
ncbi:uncharacterized protein LOC144667511 [Oculina patagonica]